MCRRLTDRTTAIRASVKDVEFELMLTVGLVVMVIFLFLRSLSATIIPSVAVPLSLVGTFGVMYLLGYSLNNLTLMALTISTGFVVDDAIVMIENISRYIEEGEAPLEAALKGAEQIGFTIMSLTVSLIAVLIPLLFMGDMVGRLFREFAVTLAVTIMISAVVSLTLTPMMCARLLHYTPPERQGRFYRQSERIFNSMIAFYGRTLKFVLRYQTIALLVAVAVLALTVLLYIFVPKGFFPTQDTGIIQGISQASASTSFESMIEKQQDLVKVLLADPAVDSVSSFIGADGTNTTLNSGRIEINLKPLKERGFPRARLIRRLRAEAGAGAGNQPLYATGAGPHRRRPRQPHRISVHARRPQPGRTERGSARAGREVEAAASTGRRGDRSTIGRSGGVVSHRPQHGFALRHHTADHRQHAVRRIRAAADEYSLHGSQSISRDPGDGYPVPARSAKTARYLHSVFPDRRRVGIRFRGTEHRGFFIRSRGRGSRAR